MRERLYNIIEGDGRESILYGKSMTAIIVLSFIPLCFWDENIVLSIIEYVCTAVFIADYLVRWITADFKLKKGMLSFFLYPFTPMAIIDLVTILPTFMILNPAWRTLRTLRLLRMLRAFELNRYRKSMIALESAIRRKRGQLLVVLVFALAYILLIAIIMFNVEHETFPTFFDALYCSVVSLTTVGYGDLYPVTTAGRVITMISSFVGIAIVAMPASIITSGLLDEIKKDQGED